MLVRSNSLPAKVWIQNTGLLLHNLKLVFSGQIVTDVVVLNESLACVGRILQKHCNGYRRAAAGTKDLATLTPGQFATCALIAPQIEDIDGAELLFQTFAHAIHGVSVQPSRIGDKGDNAACLPVYPV